MKKTIRKRKPRPSPGVQLIAAERQRQITKEQWSAEHDDGHDERELARAAGAYIGHYVGRSHVFAKVNGPKIYRSELAPDSWPWMEVWWNPQDPMRDLVKAAALIAAELDRLLRITKAADEAEDKDDKD